MTKKELFDLVDSLSGDVDFSYQDIHGSICPFSRNDISIAYGDAEKTHKSIDDALNDKFFAGKSLYEIAEEIEMW